jgi:DNA-binding MarR family transcriptional regulator
MGEVKWLSDDEQRVWRSYIAATTMLREHMERQLNTEAKMPHAYYEVLVALSDQPDHTLRMSDLAQRSRSSRSRLSHAIARLENAGWVRRSHCAEDKRGSFAHLTDEGFAALTAAAPGHVTTVRRALFDVLTPEQVRQLGEISEAIRGGLSETCAAAVEEECAQE